MMRFLIEKVRQLQDKYEIQFEIIKLRFQIEKCESGAKIEIIDIQRDETKQDNQ